MTRWETFISTLNIFQPLPSTNGEDQQEELRLSKLSSTMFYILLCVLLLSFGFSTFISEQTQVINIENPTIQQFKELPEDAQCPCKRNILSYGDFVEIEATFHQVCSSNFVTERWLRALFYGQNSTAFYMYDFRTVAHGAFESLVELCNLAKSIVERSISSFYRRQLFNKDAMKETTAMKQTLTLIEQVQLNSLSRFQAQLRLINTLILTDRLITSLLLNSIPMYFMTDPNSFVVYTVFMTFYYENGDSCSCRASSECSFPGDIYKELQSDPFFIGVKPNITVEIPGFRTSCLPMNAILVSSLDCFFNASCLNMFVSYLDTQESFRPLNSAQKSRFNQNSTIRLIAELLFVEAWSHKIFFSQYFSHCAPQSCSYLISRRFDFGLTIVKLIGLLSGLIVVLRLIVPKAVVQFSKCFYRRPPVPDNTNQPVRLKRKIWNAIQELNFFNDGTDDGRQTLYQRIATRFYIVAVIVIVLSITIRTALQIKTYKVTKFNPTLSSFIELKSLYSETLFCPCTTIAVDYATFISIEPKFHQVCSSDLVSDSWLKYNTPLGDIHYEPDDYQNQASVPFTFLTTMCEQARRTINNSLSIYLRKQYVSSSITAKNIFESQIGTSADEWRSNMIDQFLLYVELYQRLVSGNFLSNGDLNVDYLTNMETKTTQMIPKVIGNCTCGLSSACLKEIPMYKYPVEENLTTLFIVPQFYNGCFRIQSLLLSTLACFYDLSCMLEIHRYKHYPSIKYFNFSALNPSRNSPNETVGSMVNQMMVDSWSKDISYSAYYNACQPMSCSYEYTSQSNLLTIITTLLGMFGGVSLAVKLFIIITLKLIKHVSRGVAHQNAIRVVANIFQCPSEAEKITRLHIISGIITLVIVYSLTAFKPQKTTVTISRPTIAVYKDLINTHSNTTECACTKTSFEYKAFLNMNAILHQVCSSDFVRRSWIDYLYENGNLSLRYAHVDFRYSGYAQFQLLSDFCQMANKTLAKSIQQMQNDDLTNIRILSESALREHINMKINDFDQNLRDSFINMLTMMRLSIGSNKLMSVLSTNWIYDTPLTITDYWIIRRLPLGYNNCSCGHSSKCVQSSNGLLSGCYPLETILQTRFDCLFDQQCINPTGAFKTLNTTLASESRFRTNDTVEEVLNHLMVERYQVDISFEKYFDACQPITCSYSYIDRNNVIDGLTNIISLYGGLMIMCHIFSILFIKIILFRPMTEYIISR